MKQLMIPELETQAPAKARPAWPLVKWSEVLSIKNGKSQKDVVNDQGQYPIYGSGGIMGFADSFLCDENTVVLGRKGSINNPIFVETKFWNVDTAFGLAANKNQLEPKFLYYFCLSFNFEKLNTTVTIPSLTKANLLTVEMPLPPLAEQQRIVARLDLAQRLIDQRKAQLALMDQLVQSLFYEMFGDPVKNEMGWEIKKISDICTVTSGGTPDRKQASYFNGDIPWIKTGDLKQKYIKSSEESISGEGLENSSAKIFPVNTVLIALYGATIGACGILRINAATNQACGAILPTSKAIPEYIYHFLFSRRQYFISQGVGGAQPNISGSILKATSIPIPPLPLQQTFADRVQQIEALKQQMQASLAELEQGFQALMQEAFGG